MLIRLSSTQHKGPNEEGRSYLKFDSIGSFHFDRFFGDVFEELQSGRIALRESLATLLLFSNT